MITGIFPQTRTASGSPRLNAPRIDTQVADMLADGIELDDIAFVMRISRAAVQSSFDRICARVGTQALGTWRLEHIL